jgi:hypothetical protein
MIRRKTGVGLQEIFLSTREHEFSDVAQIFNLLGSNPSRMQVFSVPAEYNSAIQQIEILRYAASPNL